MDEVVTGDTSLGGAYGRRQEEKYSRRAASVETSLAGQKSQTEDEMIDGWSVWRVAPDCWSMKSCGVVA